MFLLVVIGWVFFRAPNVQDAVALLRAMFIPESGTWPIGAAVLAVMLVLAGAIAHLGPNTFELPHRWKPAAAAGLASLLLLSLVRIYGAANSPFLYFQF